MKKGVMVTVTSMLVTDFFLGLHPVMWATYGSLVFGVLLGRLIFGRSVGALLLVYSLISSVVFYLVTNFAVWILPGSMYPHTPEGLLTSYILALPFFRNSLIADFFYMTVFLAGYIAFGNVRRIGGSAAITIPQTTQNRPSELEDS